jgi:uncharacterized iron-regulated membrane protein
VYDVGSGKLLRTLSGGHYGTINCCRRGSCVVAQAVVIAHGVVCLHFSADLLWAAWQSVQLMLLLSAWCSWNATAQELYSGSSDCNIVVWAPARERVNSERDGWQRDSDGDDWSE